MAKVLVVDDEMTMVQMVGELLRSEGHQVVPFTSFPAAGESLSAVAPELVIANLRPDKNGPAVLGILQKARALNPPPLMIIVTPAASMDGSFECVERGAFDCLSKPFTPDALKLRVQRALSYQAAVFENASLRKQLQSRSHVPQIIGESPAIREVVQIIDAVADTESSILICGPAGTGKQLTARAIHGASRRRFAPFVTLDCAALVENLLEIELFGERKAPFASKSPERSGLFHEGNGGTVLLKNIGALPTALQLRLLTLLQDRQIGGTGDGAQAINVDIRLLATTEDPSGFRVTGGRTLPELHQRLTEVQIVLPPLRDRAEDIPLLIAHFLAGKVHPRSHLPCEITREAVQACRAYSWPGNVRELQNALDHACILCQSGGIQISDLPRAVEQHGLAGDPAQIAKRLNSDGAAPGQPVRRELSAPFEDPCPECFNDSQGLVPLKRFLRDQEISYLQRTLQHAGGSKERAAEMLGISLATMYRKLSEPEDATAEPA